jgi:predicted phosphodiesterase
VYAHTHERDERRVGEALIVNPGETCGWLGGIGSLAIYDTGDHSVEFREL